jgi:hypothetical protein
MIKRLTAAVLSAAFYLLGPVNLADATSIDSEDDGGVECSESIERAAQPRPLAPPGSPVDAALVD